MSNIPLSLDGSKTKLLDNDFGLSKLRPDTLKDDSSDALSGITSDNASIFSTESTSTAYSSVTSVADVTDVTNPFKATELFVFLVLEHQDLKLLFEQARKTIDRQNFKIELQRLLRNYTQELRKEAKNSLEKISAKLLWQNRQSYADVISTVLYSPKTRRTGTQSKPEENSQISDNEDDEEEEDDDPISWDFEQVHRWLTNSRAFEKFKVQLQELVEQRRAIQPDVPRVPSYQRDPEHTHTKQAHSEDAGLDSTEIRNRGTRTDDQDIVNLTTDFTDVELKQPQGKTTHILLTDNGLSKFGRAGSHQECGRDSSNEDEGFHIINLSQEADSNGIDFVEVGRIEQDIAGTRHYNGFADIGESLLVRRDPYNIHDSNAIRIDNVKGHQIGHLSRKLASKLAPYMDSMTLLVQGQLLRKSGRIYRRIRLTLFCSSDPDVRLKVEAKMKADELPLVKQVAESEVKFPKSDALLRVSSAEEKRRLALWMKKSPIPGSFPVHGANTQDHDLFKDIQCKISDTVFAFCNGKVRYISRYAYNRVIRYFRPPLAPGFRRIEWSCDCGKLLYGDFWDDNPEDLDELERYLHSSEPGQNRHTANNDTDEAGNISMPPTSSCSISSNSETTPSSQSNSTHSPSRSFCSSDTSTDSESNLGPELRPIRKYIALCVNKGEYYVALGEIEATHIKSDKEVFAEIKRKYSKLRSFRARGLRLFLIHPVDIKFVHFAVEDSHRVDIIADFHPENFPSEQEVLKNNYEYSPCPLRKPPAVPSNAFLHYMSCYDSERGLSHGTKWLQRLPKKLQVGFEELRRSTKNSEDVTGWGIYIIEGPNVAMMSLMTGILMTLSCIGSTVYAAVTGDVSGGFSIGAFVAALWGTWMAALFFRWKQY